MKGSSGKFKRVLCALLVLATVSAGAPAMAQVGRTYYSLIDGMAVYAKADSEAKPLGILNKGHKFKHLASTKKGMWKIRAKGGVGFIVPRSKSGDPFYTGTVFQKGWFYEMSKAKVVPLREKPSSNAKRLGTIPRGTVLLLNKKSNAFGLVMTQQGAVGWVHLRFLTHTAFKF